MMEEMRFEPAGVIRRLATLCIDWGISLVIALPFGYSNQAIMGSFVLMNVLMLTLFGATVGQFLLGVRVLPIKGNMPMILRAIIRTLVMLLVIPGLVYNEDKHCGQDLASGTETVKI